MNIKRFSFIFVAALSLDCFANQTTTYQYNTSGKIIYEDGPRTDVIDTKSYIYYSNGNLLSETNALGHQINFISYDSNGNLLSYTDKNGILHELEYDSDSRLIESRVVDPNNIQDIVYTYEYDSLGLLITTTMPNGVDLNYQYDDARRLIAIYNSTNERIEYILDTEGNRTQQLIKNSNGNILYSVSQVFDELSQVLQVIGNNNQLNEQEYDVNGNSIISTDGNQHSAQTIYDSLNRVHKIVDQKLGETVFTYNEHNQIQTVVDARGNVTSYQYNGLDQLLSLTSPDTGTISFTYDEAGNRIGSQDSRGITVNYTYDALNRLTAITYPTVSENVQFTYDDISNNNKSVGRLTGITQSGTTISYIYDFRGLVKKKITNVNSITKITEYQYDAAGNPTQVIYPSGRVVNYSYDLLGQIDEINTQMGSNTQTLITNIQYLPFGPATTFVYGNGLSHAQTYDPDYRITAIQVGGILDRTYDYDNANNITDIVNNLDLNQSQSFTYDELDQLTSALGGYGNLLYTYDEVGNRLSENRNGVTDTYQYATSSNQLLSVARSSGNRHFIYDSAGNPTEHTSDNNNTLNNTFNNANRLSSININSTFAVGYNYNALGQRVVKTLANGNKEIYHYDETGQLIAVTDGVGNTQREYIYWNNKQIALVSNNTLYYIHNDHLNTPQVVTNQNQAVVWMGNYEPFGKLTQNQSNSIEIFSRFPGQYFDSETNLYYNYFRDYDPSIGRYIESDPIGLEGGINTYNYVGGNPISSADPLGLEEEIIICWWPFCSPLVPLPGSTPASDSGFDHSDLLATPRPGSSSSSVTLGPWQGSTTNPDAGTAGEEAADEIDEEDGVCPPVVVDPSKCEEKLKRCKQKCMSKGEPGVGRENYSDWLGRCVIACTSKLGCSNFIPQ